MNDGDFRKMERRLLKLVIVLVLLFVLLLGFKSTQAQDNGPSVADPTWVVRNGEFWYTFQLKGFDPLTQLTATINGSGSVIGTTDAQGNFGWTVRLSDGPSSILIWGESKSLTVIINVRPDGSLRNYWTVAVDGNSPETGVPQPEKLPVVPFVRDDGTCAGLESFQRVNTLAVVNNADPLPMTVRAGASRNAAKKGQFDPGTLVRIYSGPYCAQDAIWWAGFRLGQTDPDLVYFAEVTRLGYNVKPWGLESEPFFGKETILAAAQCQLPTAVTQITQLPTAGFRSTPECGTNVTKVGSNMVNVRATPALNGQVVAKAPGGAFFPVLEAQWVGSRWWLLVYYEVEEGLDAGWISCGANRDILSNCPVNPY